MEGSIFYLPIEMEGYFGCASVSCDKKKNKFSYYIFFICNTRAVQYVQFFLSYVCAVHMYIFVNIECNTNFFFFLFRFIKNRYYRNV